MIVGRIENGIVLDHITAGRCMEIYNVLHLDQLDCTVAIIQNADSRKMGKKDILKIYNVIDLDMDILGYIDPGVTVNIIREGEVVERRALALPERVEQVIRCRNPRCITSVEPDLDQIFKLCQNGDHHTYRCLYCEQEYGK